MIVWVWAWETPEGWEWGVFPSRMHLCESDVMEQFPEGKEFTIDVFDAVADEIERQCPWIER